MRCSETSQTFVQELGTSSEWMLDATEPSGLSAVARMCPGIRSDATSQACKNNLVSVLSAHSPQMQVKQTIQTRSCSGVMMVQGRPLGKAAATAKARHLINGPKPTASQTGPEQPPEASPLHNG